MLAPFANSHWNFGLFLDEPIVLCYCSCFFVGDFRPNRCRGRRFLVDVAKPTLFHCATHFPFANGNGIGDGLSFLDDCCFVIGFLVLVVFGIAPRVFTFFLLISILSRKVRIVVEFAPVSVAAFSPLKGITHIFSSFANRFCRSFAAVFVGIIIVRAIVIDAADLLGFGTASTTHGLVVPIALGSLVVVLIFRRPQKHLAAILAVQCLGSVVFLATLFQYRFVPSPFCSGTGPSQLLLPGDVGFGLKFGECFAIGFFEGGGGVAIAIVASKSSTISFGYGVFLTHGFGEDRNVRASSLPPLVYSHRNN
mmetsp:Transcript_19976/g.42219  ORF Transcript_19976/g.42219 Transcript_19976/m.42219 type:complete len:308 (+) Transcript_19976:793-1716(+)